MLAGQTMMTFRIVGSSLMTPMAWMDTEARLIGNQSALTLGSKADPFFFWKSKSSSPGFIDRNGFSPTGTAPSPQTFDNVG